MDVGVWPLMGVPDALTAPLGFLDEMRAAPVAAGEPGEAWSKLNSRNRVYDLYNIPHSFTGVRVSEKGLDMLAEYVSQVREVIGYDVPLAADHFGHIGLQDCIKIAQRLDPYNLAWYEDMLPWQLTDQYVQLSHACQTPICTGEDTYLKEGFKPLLESGGVAIIHPDLLTAGGILEMKKIGDLAQEHSVAMAVHMAESPIGCMACVHMAAATENFVVLENHSVDCPWWGDLVTGPSKPIIQNGFIPVPDAPGLGIESLNDELIAQHLDPADPHLWAPTTQWDNEYCHDRLWS
jgi:gluconate/galactonate dehydratase